MAIRDEIEDMATTFGKCKEFMEADFNLGAGEDSVMSPPRRTAVASWTNYYQCIIEKLGQVGQ